MPAVNLVILRTKLNLVFKNFQDAKEFTKGLRGIYSYYSDPTLPIGIVHARLRTISAFNTPPLLQREVELAFEPYTQSDPENLLHIIDHLWEGPEAELRQLAAFLLGKIDLSYKNDVLQRIKAYANQKIDQSIHQYLFQFGSGTIRKQEPLTWIAFLDPWLNSQETLTIKLGIQAIIPIINDPDFSNLPLIYRSLEPVFRSSEPLLFFETRNVMEHLIRRSEIETVYFLKLLFSDSKSESLAKLIRNLLPAFSSLMQDSLRKTLKENQ